MKNKKIGFPETFLLGAGIFQIVLGHTMMNVSTKDDVVITGIIITVMGSIYLGCCYFAREKRIEN